MMNITQIDPKKTKNWNQIFLYHSDLPSMMLITLPKNKSPQVSKMRLRRLVMMEKSGSKVDPNLFLLRIVKQ